MKAVLLLLIVAVSAAAVEPSDANQLWQERFEGSATVLAPEQVVAGSQFQMTLALDPDVEDVKYQICRIGEACFAIGVPTVRTNAGWELDTADLPTHVAHLPDAPQFEQGQRIGIQYFLCFDAPCPEDVSQWELFPEGLPDNHTSFNTDFVAWSESHYFGVNIAPEQTANGPHWLLLGTAIAAAVILVRRRE